MDQIRIGGNSDYDDVEPAFIEQAQVDDLKASDNNGILLHDNKATRSAGKGFRRCYCVIAFNLFN